MNRRSFLVRSAASAFSLHALRLWAAPAAADRKLLIVMLRGAYDGASLLVPYSSSLYYEARPSIAIARPDARDPYAGIALSPDYALNPAVKETLMPLWQQKQLAFIPFSGSEDVSRSHFQAQDLMELGQSPRGRLDYGSGYLNRLVEELGGRCGVSFTQNMTPIFKGEANVPNISLKGRPGPVLPDRHANLLAQMYEGSKLGAMAGEGMQTTQSVARELSEEMMAASGTAQAAAGFERSARSIAALMRTRPEYAVAFVDVGGWDTHVNQGSATGQLAGRLEGLARGLTAFAQDMGPAWKNTVVVVMSEFGRTFGENGNRGTDHGHGNTMWVMGGSIAGGQIAGEQTVLNAASLNEGRDLPVLNDYRSVLLSLFAGMYGLPKNALDRILPGAQAASIKLV